MKMLSGKIGVIPIEDPSISPGGIIIPEEGKQKADKGVVKYRASDVKDVRVGEVVLFHAYAGTKVTDGDEGIVLILKEEQVEAILDEEGAPTIISIKDAQRIVQEAISLCQQKDIDDLHRVEAHIVEMLEHYIYDWGYEF